MSEQSSTPLPETTRRFPFFAGAVVIVAVFACSIYANLSFMVTNRANFRYFPPFKPYHDANMNRHLGAEYFNIAKALYSGEGFSNPFPAQTGPTAWMPPLLAGLEAGLLWLCEGDRDSVMGIVVFLQVYTLILTGLLILALTSQTTHRIWTWVVVFLYIGTLLCNFHLCFQVTHDCWFILLGLDLVIAGFCWLRPLNRRAVAAGWGVFGGICALINPIVAFVWGILTLIVAVQHRAWTRFGIAVVLAGITLAPWTIRNYLIFGRLIPVKSNLAYELYQSQCLQPDGLIQRTTFSHHPYGGGRKERDEYKALGEMAFLDRKRDQFWQVVAADPLEFVDRVACRFLGVAVWYVPFDRVEALRRPWALWLGRLTHPLPFLALLVLVGTAAWAPLHRAQWVVIGVYVLYLSPYIGISYYDRYGMPLVGVKALLVIWAVDRLLALWPRNQIGSDQQVASSTSARTGRQTRVAVATR